MIEVGYYTTDSNGQLNGDALCLVCTTHDEDRDPEISRPWAMIAFNDEADTPTHCSRCEALIPHALTPEGYAYVKERLDDAAGRFEILDLWRERYTDAAFIRHTA